MEVDLAARADRWSAPLHSAAAASRGVIQRTSSGTPQVGGNARERPSRKTCPVKIPAWVPYTGPRTDAFGFFRSARRRVLCSTLSLPMTRDGQQSDRDRGLPAVDACRPQGQGVCVQNGLDLSGSTGDRRGSPGRSERRFPLTRTVGHARPDIQHARWLARASVDHGPDTRLGGLQAEQRDRPGQARPLPRPEVGIWGKLGDQVEHAAVGAGGADLRS